MHYDEQFTSLSMVFVKIQQITNRILISLNFYIRFYSSYKQNHLISKQLPHRFFCKMKLLLKYRDRKFVEHCHLLYYLRRSIATWSPLKVFIKLYIWVYLNNFPFLLLKRKVLIWHGSAFQKYCKNSISEEYNNAKTVWICKVDILAPYLNLTFMVQDFYKPFPQFPIA